MDATAGFSDESPRMLVDADSIGAFDRRSHHTSIAPARCIASEVLGGNVATRFRLGPRASPKSYSIFDLLWSFSIR